MHCKASPIVESNLVMEEAWIWYGPDDPVSLSDIRQTGASSVSTALYEIPAGDIWELDKILERKAIVEEAGLTWSVCESIAVHEVLKKGGPEEEYTEYLEKYKESLENLGRAGIPVLSYSFTPLFDWLRTDVSHLWHDGSTALAFNMDKFRVFDLLILKRPNSEESYTKDDILKARNIYNEMTEEDLLTLSNTILAGLHGQEPYESTDSLQTELDSWRGVTKDKMARNLQHFVAEILPVAEKWDIKLSLHPDDPPRSIFGLPNVASTLEDYDMLFNAVPSPRNGMTFCMGSLASRPENDVQLMVRHFKNRVHFVHLRNVMKTQDGGLVESGHIEGDVDIVGIIDELVGEKMRRDVDTATKNVLPMRADHGHMMKFGCSSELRTSLPGHSLFGRARGLAEIRGIQAAILKVRKHDC